MPASPRKIPQTRKIYENTPKKSSHPKEKTNTRLPPGTPTPKTPRLQISAKIRQKLEPKHPPVPTQAKKIPHPKKKNPHPHHNQQEFVKVGQNLLLLKHRGLATSSRTKSLKPKKIDPPPPEANLRIQISNLEAAQKPHPSNSRRKSENFTALLDFFNSTKNPPTSPPRFGKNPPKHQNKENPPNTMTEPGSKPLERHGDQKSNLTTTLMPQKTNSPENSYPKPSNPSPARPLENLAMHGPSLLKIRSQSPRPPPPPQQDQGSAPNFFKHFQIQNPGRQVPFHQSRTRKEATLGTSKCDWFAPK